MLFRFLVRCFSLSLPATSGLDKVLCYSINNLSWLGFLVFGGHVGYLFLAMSYRVFFLWCLGLDLGLG